LAEVFRIVNEQTRQPIENPVGQVLIQGHAVGLANHTVLLTADGRELPIDDSAAPIRDRQGKLTGVVLVFRDVTQRKRAERELRESEQRLRTILESMPVMITAFDSNGTYAFWNRECEAVTGYSAREIIGNPQAIALLYPDATYREATFREWQAKQGDFQHWERDIVRKDGSRRTIAWSSISQQFPISGWLGWGTGIDVTERNRASERLRFLLDANSRLSGSLDYEVVLTNLARLAVSFLADWCVVDTLEPDGLFHRTAVAAAEPAKETLVRTLQQKYPVLRPESRHTLLNVFQSKQSWIDPEVSRP
jgi:PAS domain S-box-containing protein